MGQLERRGYLTRVLGRPAAPQGAGTLCSLFCTGASPGAPLCAFCLFWLGSQVSAFPGKLSVRGKPGQLLARPGQRPETWRTETGVPRPSLLLLACTSGPRPNSSIESGRDCSEASTQ